MTKMIIAALIFGFALSAIYDAFKLIDKIFLNNILLFVLDVIFCVAFSFATYSYFIAYNNGKIRIIPIVAEVIGFLLYRITVGAFTNKLILVISKRIRAFFVQLKYWHKSLQKNVKKVLQMGNKVLYNGSIKKGRRRLMPKTKLKKKENKTKDEKYIQE